MGAGWLQSPRAAWALLHAVHVLAIGGGVMVAAYALVLLRAQKMEVVYRVEGVPFAAGPQGVPPEKWGRMSAVQLEIVEPMADWVLYVAVALVALSAVSLCLLIRLSPFAAPRPDAAPNPQPTRPAA